MISIIEIYHTADPGWEDISDYVLKFGKFDVLFNNFDFTLKTNVIDAVFSNSLPYTSGRIRVRQNSKTLFYGFIKKIKYDQFEKVYNAEIGSYIDILDLYKINESLDKTDFDNNCILANLTVPAVGTFQSYEVASIFTYLFSSLFGVTLYVLEGIMSGYHYYIPRAALWNLGCESVSALASNRDFKNIITYKKFLNDFCVFTCSRLVWDADNDQFNIIRIDKVSARTAPSDANSILKKEYEYLDFRRNTEFSGKNLNPVSDYVETGSTIYTPEDYTFTNVSNSYNESISATVSNNLFLLNYKVLDPPDYIASIGYNIFTNTILDIFEKQYTFTKYRTPWSDITNDFANISEASGIFNKGLVESEIEIYIEGT